MRAQEHQTLATGVVSCHITSTSEHIKEDDDFSCVHHVLKAKRRPAGTQEHHTDFLTEGVPTVSPMTLAKKQ